MIFIIISHKYIVSLKHENIFSDFLEKNVDEESKQFSNQLAKVQPQSVAFA